MRISDWSSDVCSSDLNPWQLTGNAATQAAAGANINCTFAERPRNANGVTVGETIGDHYFPTSSRSFRTQKTSEIRDGLIGAIQWRPSPEFEIAIDGQYSKRRSLEDRNVLGISEGLSELQSLMRISYALF